MLTSGLFGGLFPYLISILLGDNPEEYQGTRGGKSYPPLPGITQPISPGLQSNWVENQNQAPVSVGDKGWLVLYLSYCPGLPEGKFQVTASQEMSLEAFCCGAPFKKVLATLRGTTKSGF